MAPSSSLKPITIYAHVSGPNPWKCAIVMEELDVPYEMEIVDFSVIKQAPFTDINPNGRVPAIHDPNTGLTLWESGAILTYLVEQYDTDRKVSYDPSDLVEKHTANQWLHFQVSGQGPYFGQSVWFRRFHSEKIPSAMERYANEAKRVSTVIDSHLKKSGTTYLTGDKCTYADLSFVPWFQLLGPMVIGEEAKEELERGLPHYKKWVNAMYERESVKKISAKKAELMAGGK